VVALPTVPVMMLLVPMVMIIGAFWRSAVAVVVVTVMTMMIMSMTMLVVIVRVFEVVRTRRIIPKVGFEASATLVQR
jgi:hypothetical protein